MWGVFQALAHLGAARVEQGGAERDEDALPEQLVGQLQAAREAVHNPRPLGMLAPQGAELVEGAHAVDDHRLLLLFGDGDVPEEELLLPLPAYAAGLVKSAFAYELCVVEAGAVFCAKLVDAGGLFFFGIPRMDSKTAGGDDTLRSLAVCMEINQFHYFTTSRRTMRSSRFWKTTL